VGSIGFGGPPDVDGAVVLGYATYPGAQGHGYATEACQALVEWAWTHESAKKVCATVPNWNTSSVRVAEKLGMRKLGIIWDEDLGEDVELWAVERPAIAVVRA
jgi:ribosomal-protein-alanine N-acetyltransferase